MKIIRTRDPFVRVEKKAIKDGNLSDDELGFLIRLQMRAMEKNSERLDIGRVKDLKQSAQRTILKLVELGYIDIEEGVL